MKYAPIFYATLQTNISVKDYKNQSSATLLDPSHSHNGIVFMPWLLTLMSSLHTSRQKLSLPALDLRETLALSPLTLELPNASLV
jgi:hypothetical protein